jgi:sterol desaturase/sphingolipid hydroxylase (fatty acid hydroxylase superfamily)
LSELFIYAIPFFLLTMAGEHLLTRSQRLGYEIRDSLASVAMGIGFLLIAVAMRLVNIPLIEFLHMHRVFDVPDGAVWLWPVLILAEDFSFYWYHRAGHEVRVFWSSHINHHSSQRYNLSTALRQPWLSPFVRPMFWFPIPLLGFDPMHLITAQAISLLYQYLLHTELVGKLPRVIAWVFNTPSHHRVHHGADPQYLDRNYGGIFIIWDRLFGTFEAEAHTPRYGLTRDIDTFNPLRIAFHELNAMARDAWNARTLRGKLGYLFARPGWREDGTGKTSIDLRREAEAAAA